MIYQTHSRMALKNQVFQDQLIPSSQEDEYKPHTHGIALGGQISSVNNLPLFLNLSMLYHHISEYTLVALMPMTTLFLFCTQHTCR